MLFFVFSIGLSYLFYLITFGKYNEYPLFVYFNLFNHIPVFVLGMILYKLRPIKFSNIIGFLVLEIVFIIIFSVLFSLKRFFYPSFCVQFPLQDFWST